MTYRERREAKAERLREWAAKRNAGVLAVARLGEKYRGDHAFNTQPGHIPERARLIAAEDRAFESLKKAQGMESRAAEIERQAERAIYDDDPGALDRLREKQAGLEALRESKRALGAAWRKAKKPASTDAAGWAKVAELLGVDPDSLTIKRGVSDCRSEEGFLNRGPVPGYVLQNLGGNITRCRERIKALERRAQSEATLPDRPTKDETSPGSGYVALRFPEPPGHAVTSELRSAGFHWNKNSLCWYGNAGKFERLPESVRGMFEATP